MLFFNSFLLAVMAVPAYVAAAAQQMQTHGAVQLRFWFIYFLNCVFWKGKSQLFAVISLPKYIANF